MSIEYCEFLRDRLINTESNSLSLDRVNWISIMITDHNFVEYEDYIIRNEIFKSTGGYITTTRYMFLFEESRVKLRNEFKIYNRDKKINSICQQSIVNF